MKEQTQTPRTDAAGQDGMYSTMVNHALRLELELNAAKAEIAEIIKQRDEWFSVVTHKTRQVNDLKALVEQNGKLAHDYSIAAVKFKGQLNEAITELSHIANLLDDHFEEGGTIAGIGTTNKARKIIEKSKQ